MRSLASLATLVLVAAAPSAFAKTVIAVGGCDSSKPNFATIQGAVDASGATATTTIEICPGTYPEQVSVVGKKVLLTGIASGNQSQAAIVAPAGGIVANATSLSSGNPIAAQILVSGGGSATISGLTVDGANSGIAGTCAINLVGILYQNASGIVRSNHVLNQALTADLAGCQSGLGIFVQSGQSGTSNVQVTGNNVENFQKNGITGDEAGTTLAVTKNIVVGQGATTGAAENAIQIAFGATGSIQSNTVGDTVWAPDQFGDTGNAAAGILVYASGAVPVTGNTVTSTQYGIAIEGDGNGDGDGSVVSSNVIARTHLYDGIDICGASSVTANGNVINGSDEAAIHIDSSCGSASTGNTVSGNKVNGACAGILVGAGSATPSGNNTILNAASAVATGSDVCQGAPGARAKRARCVATHDPRGSEPMLHSGFPNSFGRLVVKRIVMCRPTR